LYSKKYLSSLNAHLACLSRCVCLTVALERMPLISSSAMPLVVPLAFETSFFEIRRLVSVSRTCFNAQKGCRICSTIPPRPKVRGFLALICETSIPRVSSNHFVLCPQSPQPLRIMFAKLCDLRRDDSLAVRLAGIVLEVVLVVIFRLVERLEGSNLRYERLSPNL
jgi:hypothetical protein